MQASYLGRELSRGMDRVAKRRRARRPFAELPPGPWEPPVAQLYQFLFRPQRWLLGCRDRFGQPFTMRIPGMPPLVTFSDPEAAKDLFTGPPDELHAGKANAVLEPFLGEFSLLLLDGQRHLAQRRVLLPPFRGDRMRAYGDAIHDITRRVSRRWELGQTFELQPEAQAITLDVILRTVFGVEGAEEDTLRDLLVSTLRIIDNPLYIVRWAQLDLGSRTPWGRFVENRRRVHELLHGLIQRRRSEDRSGRTDILSMMLDAQHEDGSPMSDPEVRDELMTLLIAGHETTATALSWAVHRLTLHPAMRRRVQGELDEAYGDGEVDPAAPLPYLDAFCRETLRVHPVIPGVGRVLQAPQHIGGYDLPAGVVVGCNIWLIHMNPDVWPEPERFDPTRFLGRRASPYEFLPFGGGVRRCIGEAFALYEMRVVLATILRSLSPQAAPGVTVETTRRNITLSPSDNMPVRFRRR